MDHTHSELPPGEPTSEMDHTQFELPSVVPTPEAVLSAIEVLRLVFKDKPKAREAARVLFQSILSTAEPTPPEPIHKAVDNSPSESLETESIVFRGHAATSSAGDFGPQEGLNNSRPKGTLPRSISNSMLLVHDPNVHERGCSASTVVDAPSQADLPRRPVLSLMVSPTPMNGRNKSALVVEYNQSLSGMFTRFLKSDHYLVRTAYKSEDALRLYRDCGPFEVVLIQYGMPNKDGVDIALDILKDDPTQPMIIIAPDYPSEDEVPRRKELMNIPFLLNLSNSRFRKVLDKLQPWATREEVDWATDALSTAELLRLQQYGDWRVRFSRGADHRAGEDLLQEALRLTFEGDRRWNKRVTFEKYLYGAIKSITRRRKGDNALLACDTFKIDAEGQEYCLLDNVAACDMAADERLIAEETFNRILGQFKDDPEGMLVLQGWSEGMKRNEITQEGLSENQYRAAVKRIRMKLLSRRNGSGGGEKHDGQD
jgi:CheY-like chemotaxis protein